MLLNSSRHRMITTISASSLSKISTSFYTSALRPASRSLITAASASSARNNLLTSPPSLSHHHHHHHHYTHTPIRFFSQTARLIEPDLCFPESPPITHSNVNLNNHLEEHPFFHYHTKRTPVFLHYDQDEPERFVRKALTQREKENYHKQISAVGVIYIYIYIYMYKLLSY